MPVIDEKVANNADVNFIAREESNRLGVDKRVASIIRTEFTNLAGTHS